MAVMLGPQREAKYTKKMVVRVVADTAGALDEPGDRLFYAVDRPSDVNDRRFYRSARVPEMYDRRILSADRVEETDDRCAESVDNVPESVAR